MVYKPRQFINDEIYHIIIRGVGEEIIFKDINDYYRGIFSIYEFNNNKPTIIRERRRVRAQLKTNYRELLSVIKLSVGDERDKFVEILAFCFMPNHIHLLVRQIKEGGISKFMMKLGAGYGGYYNRKYGRKGHLFQNRFSSVHIKDDDQLKIVFIYIHTNPLSLIEPGWKEIGIKNPERAIKFLEEEYRWSSYFDYIGKKNFPSMTNRDFLLEVMGGEDGCKDAIKNWVLYHKDLSDFNNLFLE